MTTRITRRRPAKFGGSAKVTLTALSLMSFIGGWNIIARAENSEAAANEPPPTVPAVAPPPAAQPTPTPWPTVAPLAELPPIPTLVPTLTSSDTGAAAITIDTNLAPVKIAPLATLAPLPPMPQAPPPPPPPPPMPAGGWQQSGGS